MIPIAVNGNNMQKLMKKHVKDAFKGTTSLLWA